jgi:alkylation response protein AidB-like acyl-CoA dehydrogenase
MMHLALNEEQLEVAAVANRFLAKELPLPRVRELAAADAPLAIDDDSWRRCADLGWFALGVPERCGGIGYGPLEELALFRELGRHLAPGPFVPTVVAGWVAAASRDATLGESLWTGHRRAGLVVGPLALDAEYGGLAVRVDDGGAEVLEVAGLRDHPAVDASVRLATVELGPVVARSDDPLIAGRAQVLVAAVQLGIAEAVLDMSVAYAKERTQFGKPIGTFQAVKHRCADMAMRVHAAKAQTLFAAVHVERRASDAAFQAACALLVANRAANLNAADNVQNHGAIGFTVEHDAGLFARRAHMNEHSIGGQAGAGPVVLAPERHLFHSLRRPPDDWFQFADPEAEA